ncbi:UNVERIFIED_CONTAM: hypothetical protein FKN15_069745 [Acipenser sinensis]
MMLMKLLSRNGQLKSKLSDCNKTSKGFSRPKRGRFPEIKNSVSDFLIEQQNSGFPVSREVIRAKACERADAANIQRSQFKASLGWVEKFMKWQGFSLRRRTTVCQKLPEEIEEKLLQIQHFDIRLRSSKQYLRREAFTNSAF